MIQDFCEFLFTSILLHTFKVTDISVKLISCSANDVILSDEKKLLILNHLWFGQNRCPTEVFQPSSVQSLQFQTLAPLTTIPAQHMSPVD